MFKQRNGTYVCSFIACENNASDYRKSITVRYSRSARSERTFHERSFDSNLRNTVCMYVLEKVNLILRLSCILSFMLLKIYVVRIWKK